MATPTTVQAEAETEVKAPSSLETSASPALAFATEIKAQTTTATIESKTWDGEYPPLTTLWTMPDSCGFTMDLDHQAKDGEAPTVYIDWTIERGATTFSCYPPGMFEAGNSGTFSPANCPLGWTTEDFKGSAFEQVKTRTCCSKDYTVQHSYCQKVETGLIRPTGVTFISGTHRYIPPHNVTTTPITGATLAHHMVVILLEEKDQGILGVTDDDIFVSDGRSGRISNLSIGAKVGIGVGAFASFSALLLLLIWLIRSRVCARREAQRRKNQPYELGGVRGRARRGDDSLCGDSEETIGSAPPPPEAAVAAAGPPLEVIDPPPAYEAASPSQLSLDAADGAGTPRREDELRALKAQRECIQRRIKVLEREVVAEESERGSSDAERRSAQSREREGV